MWNCRIEADSISKCSGHRITTFVVTYPRMIHAQMMTHQLLSRNSSSSRAIPTKKLIEQVRNDPYIPEKFAYNQKGMQPGSLADATAQLAMRDIWECALESAIIYAETLAEENCHKQWVNRILEPYSWITVIYTATEWENFFHLRCHPEAQEEITRIATMMKEAYEASTPHPLSPHEWHLPFIQSQEREQHSIEDLLKISTGRCARVSYLTHEGQRDPEKDIELHDRLVLSQPAHASPTLHQARPMRDKWDPNTKQWEEWAEILLANDWKHWYEIKEKYVSLIPFREQDVFEDHTDSILAKNWWCANYRGWVPYRKHIPNEAKW